MSARKTRRGILLLGLVAGFTWIVSRQPAETPTQPISEPDMRLNYALYDFNGRMLDPEGRIRLEIESPELRNDAFTGIGSVEQPAISIRQGPDRWYITAESAIITADREQVSLQGSVELTRRNEINGQQVEISTKDVLLNVTPRTATTDSDVSIREGGDRLDAVGLRLDMVTETYQLVNDVRGHYAVP